MIEFKRVKCKNFLSYGNYWTEVDFTALPGTTLVTGKNASGKSSIILDTLAFGLFGVPYRFINKPRLVNSINGSDCVVEVEFAIGPKNYRVVRGIKPNVFEIYCDGILLNQSSKTLDYQRYLETHILKLNFDSFCQIVVLGSATFVPFMELSSQDRRSVIEDLLDLKVFTSMNDVLKKRYTETKDQLKSVENKILVQQEKIAMQQDYCKRLVANQRTSTEKMQAEIDEAVIRIAAVQTEIDGLQEKMKEMAGFKDQASKKSKTLSSYTSTLNALKDRRNVNRKKIDYYTNNQVCDNCGQGIETTFKDQKLASYTEGTQKIETAIVDVENTVAGLRSEIEDLNQKMSGMIEITYQQGEKTAEITMLNRKISDLNKTIGNQTHTDLDAEKLKLTSLENELGSYLTEKDGILNVKKNYDAVYLLLKDGGIKSKIIKQYLPTINKCINKYLAAMDFFVNFNLDETFKETIKSRNRDVFEYNSFSQGEKFRIDMALMLTWREVSKSKNSVNTNILVLDEVFDGSMDSHGTDEFLKLINHVANDGVSVFVISHKNDSYTDKFSNYIKVEKKSNFSRMEIL